MLEINGWRLSLFFIMMFSGFGEVVFGSDGEKPAYSKKDVSDLLTKGVDKGVSSFGRSSSSDHSSPKIEKKEKEVTSKAQKPKFKGKSQGFCDIGNISDVDLEVSASISSKLRKVVLEQADEDNEHWQKQIEKIKSHYREIYEKKLKEKSLGACAAESVSSRYANVWLSGMNAVVKISVETTEKESDDLGFSDEEDEEEASKVVREKRTTILNIALRYGKDEAINKKDFLKKILTLIDNGADKNLNPEFTSGSMLNQPEIPLQIVFREIKDPDLISSLLTEIFFNDERTFKIEKQMEGGRGTERVRFDDPRTAPAIVSVEKDYNYLLEKFYEEKNFDPFDFVLRYLESHDKFITEDYNDKTAGIENQVRLPLLYVVLKEMRKVREKSLSLDSAGNRKDNISEFFNWPVVKNSLNRNYDTMFGTKLQNQLKHDYDKEFKSMAKIIDNTRSTTDLKGKQLKENVIAWTEMANFRNRLAYHLNRYALTQAVEGSRSNVVKLVRYARMSDNEKQRVGQTNDDAIYAELAVLQGLDAIFLRSNSMRWTPLMYAMSQRQSEGLPLLLHQAVHPITLSDGVGNNLLHLAFPLPEKFLTSTENKDDDNPLSQVGAGIGEPDFVTRTTDCINTVLEDDERDPVTGELVISDADRIQALTKKSALNFTPVSLAAMTGFYKLYDSMKRYLEIKGAWFEEDHSRIGYHVDELVIRGIEAFRKQKEILSKEDPNKTWSEEENREFISEINKRKKLLSDKYKKAIRQPYTRDSGLAKKRYEEIRAAGDSYLEEFDKKNVREQTGNPYAEALKRAMNAMTSPQGKVVEKPYQETGVEVVQPVVPKKKTIFSIFKKEEVVPEIRVEKKPETYKVVEESILDGLSSSTSGIQASYLRPYVEKLVRRFLSENENPQKMPLDIAYRRITDRKEQNFFEEHFSSKVLEREMFKTIQNTMKNEGRLFEAEKEETVDEDNIFSAIRRAERSDDDESDEGESGEDSGDESSWYEEDSEEEGGGEKSDEDTDE